MAARPEKKLPVLPMEVLDDISCRFFNTIPTEELEEDSHIGSQIEMAHWFYLDHTLKRDPTLPRLGISVFSRVLSRHCPILKHSEFGSNFVTIWNEYKRKIPVCGAILVNPSYEKIILVQSMDPKSPWTFPRGKKNRNETPESCAMREVFEETGFNIEEHPNALDLNEYIFDNKGQSITLYFVRNVPDDFVFQPKTECEIGKIEWFDVESVYSSTAPCFKFIKSTMPKIRKWMIKERQQHLKSLSGAFRNPKSSSGNVSTQTSSSSSFSASDRVPSPAPTSKQNGTTSPSIVSTDPQPPTTQKTSSPQTSPLPVPPGQYLPLGYHLPIMNPYLIQPSPTTPYLPNPNANINSNGSPSVNPNGNLANNNNNTPGPLQNSQGNENGSNVLRSSTGPQYPPYHMHPGFMPPRPAPFPHSASPSPSGPSGPGAPGQNPNFPFGFLPSYPPSYPPPPSFSFVPQTQPTLPSPTANNPTANR